ncbi:MIP/aquaporin family protein [Dongshaea marina]|uniref:MIP/aquaporin family protein n=1 Tax=Dongshaea marina TaxID=2047966 RepID=UPI000D3E3989|nr:MIP/aquaporin family protein [Dongshaea marina]
MSLKSQDNLLGECIAEFLGTGLLIFFGAGCVAAKVLSGAEFGQWEISITWGLGVAIAIYVAGGVSGAHINPAVTLALAAFKGFEKRKIIPYIIAQVAGAFCAAALVYFLYMNLFHDWETTNHVVRGSAASLQTAGIFSTYPYHSLSNFHAFLVELTITAVLMMGILALTDDNNGAPKGMAAALLIGLLIAVIGASIGPLTGFAMNPARDFGPKLFTYLAGWGDIALSGGRADPYFWVPILGPIVGAQVGAFIYLKLVSPYLPAHRRPTSETNDKATDSTHISHNA